MAFHEREPTVNAGEVTRLATSLGFACMITALLPSALLGLLELAHPAFTGRRYTLTPAAMQLWVYAALQALKPAGFLAGLYGFFLIATRRGRLLTFILALTVIGGAFYAVVWIMIAVMGRDDAIYIGNRAIGSDAHSNGGMLFLWLAPVAIGVAAVLVRDIARWKAAWPVAVGVLGSQLFGLLAPGLA